MADTHKARFSRDGDQFHYLWAARRCLRLLQPASGLVAVSIEGPSAQELHTSLEDGIEVIDVGEYYGAEQLSHCKLLHYIQLKHSTQNADAEWTPSGLRNTICEFASRYKKLKELGNGFPGKIQFSFVSNRPIAANVIQTLEDIVGSRTITHTVVFEKLRSFVSLSDEQFIDFCTNLRLAGSQCSYEKQRFALQMETHAYLPDNDSYAPVQLKELVTAKALSESINNPSIRKADVLRALGTTEDRLFPAPSRMENILVPVPRAQERQLANNVIDSKDGLIIHASGGTGKSILAQRLALHLPSESVCIVYDCFGNGEYRQRSRPRHRHKDALVQIANELATLGLCDPLIESSKADAAAYTKAFIHRLRQSADAVRSKAISALCCIVIDAADNAQMAAEEFGDQRAFICDLFREQLPEGVRLVALCRTERIDKLDSPIEIRREELLPFEPLETANHLRTRFKESSEHDIEEFHNLTAGNPRVQANALADSKTLRELLRSLGQTIYTVDSMIESQLERSLGKLIDHAAKPEKDQIHLICTGLAVLKPLVPISVLATISGVHESAIKSFASDFGRPLLLTGESVQFRDEPVETWFRKRFNAGSDQLNSFVDKLVPFSTNVPYVGACLPFLMLEAGRLDELVEMALAGKGLPDNDPLDKREIELQRLQFALKACLRNERYLEASKLAFKAGAECAGDTRQRKLIQNNTDLLATLLDRNTVQEIAFGRRFDTEWLGGQHAYEASLLSYLDHYKGDARSRLRMAHEWLRNWATLSPEDRQNHDVTYQDIAELAITQYNVHGKEACIKEFSLWTNRLVCFHAGRILAKRFIDVGRYEDLSAIAESAGSNICLVLAIALELRFMAHLLHRKTIERAIRFLRKLPNTSLDSDTAELLLLALVSLIEQACVLKLDSAESLASLLDKYLPSHPPHGMASHDPIRRLSILSAYALRAGLRRQTLELADFAYPQLRKQLDPSNTSSSESRELRDFRACIGSLLPWHILRIENLISDSELDISALLDEALKQSNAAANSIYRENFDTSNEVAKLWFSIILTSPEQSSDLITKFTAWHKALRRPLSIPTWNYLARCAARVNVFHSFAYEFTSAAFELTTKEKMDSESKAASYIDCARSLLTLDKHQAKDYFDHAIIVISKLGDEVFPRWESMMVLAERNGGVHSSSAVAYRFARCAEVAKEYLYDNFDTDATLSALCSLHAPTALAVVSRWRDRKFEPLGYTLPVLVMLMLDRKVIPPQLAALLVAFQGKWDYVGFLRIGLQQISVQAEKQRLFDHVCGYVWKGEGKNDLEKLAALGAEHSLDINFLTSNRGSGRRWENDSYNTRFENKTTVWSSELFDTDLTTTLGLETAYLNCRKKPPPLDMDSFWKEVVNRIPLGREADFLQAYSQAAVIDLFNLRELIHAIPESWKKRSSLVKSLRTTIIHVCERYRFVITNSRRFQPFPLKLASEFGLSSTDLISAVLVALGKGTENLDSPRLFSLVELIAPRISEQEAMEVLDFAITLLEDDLTVEDADGPWSLQLNPPEDLEHAVAAFLWATLSAPEATLRWQACHAVRATAVLQQASVFDALMQRIRSQTGGAFSDASFPFYDLHAQLYLLISASRIAIEWPERMRPHVEVLAHLALEESHVLIRHFAQLAALSLHAYDNQVFGHDILERLAKVNKSPFTGATQKPQHRGLTQSKSIAESERFYFGIDFPSYWFSTLAECFGTDVNSIELRAQEIIRKNWKFAHAGEWKKDPRHTIYHDRETYHSHGSYPKTDDLNFYLSYHSMMVVAGELLSTFPIGINEWDPKVDNFESWFSRHKLTRSDGYWLADRRDPLPVPLIEWNPIKSKDWQWMINHNDFASALGLQAERKSVWGRWTQIHGDLEQTVGIRSALVCPERSEALMRALQTAENYYRYRLPEMEDDTEINFNGYHLKGWICCPEIGNKLDEFDPWSGDIKYPPISPSSWVCDLLNLQNKDDRDWYLPTKAYGGCQSLIWGQWNAGDNEGDHGHRLEADTIFVEELLSRSSMDLIIEVTIKREIRRPYYEGESDEEIEFVQPYCKIFVLKAGGKIVTL